jgi:hypothetical protein
MANIGALVRRLIDLDSHLAAYRPNLVRRMNHIRAVRERLTTGRMGSAESACGHTYFGLHRTETGWTFQEWAPNATAIHLVGNFSEWNADPSFALTRLNHGGAWDSRCFDYAKLEVVHFLPLMFRLAGAAIYDHNFRSGLCGSF